MDNKPNIVLIVLDTARAQSFSCYGYPRTTTPNIDQLAQDATLFVNAISPSPWTLPSHASIFTGMYPSCHGAHEITKFYGNPFPTIAEVLHSNGYHTCALSNNSWVSPYFGLGRGFDTFFKLWQIYQRETDVPALKRMFSEDKQKLKALAKLLKPTDLCANLVNAIYQKYFYKENYDSGAKRINHTIHRLLSGSLEQKQPFFLFVNYLETHLKYRAPEPYFGRFLPDGISKQSAKRVDQDAFAYISGATEMRRADFKILTALYDAELAYLDFRVGELFKYFENKNLLHNTLFIITSDHGENIGEHKLMDHQYCLYDTLLKVPLIVRYPNAFPKGQRISAQVQTIDIFPTILELIDHHDTKLLSKIQGKTLLPEKLKDQDRSLAFAEYLGPQPAVDILAKRYSIGRDQVAKYDRSLRTVRTPQWKLIQASDGLEELYNISQDPDEQVNLIGLGMPAEGDLRKSLDEVEQMNSRTSPGESEQKEIDDEVRKRLESLGYLT